MSEVRWWDSATDRGPQEISDLPISPMLGADLAELQEDLRELHEKRQGSSDSYERYALDDEAADLDERATELWLRARAELVRDYAVGFLGREMDGPAWSPTDLDDRNDND